MLNLTLNKLKSILLELQSIINAAYAKIGKKFKKSRKIKKQNKSLIKMHPSANIINN